MPIRSESLASSAAAQKRIAIAREVLKLLDAKALTPSTAVVLQPDSLFEFDNHSAKQTCLACACGAMILATISMSDASDRVDQLEVISESIIGDRDWRANTALGVLGDTFSDAQLALIETAFMVGVKAGTSTSYGPEWGVTLGEDRCREANEFAKLSGVPEGATSARLRAIMRNVIDHGGEFKPEIPAGKSP